MEFVLTTLPVLQVQVQVRSLKLRIWRAITYCQRIATFIGKTWPPKKMAPEFNEVLSRSVKIINYIKTSALNTRLLKALCNEMGSHQQNLIFHSEVR